MMREALEWAHPVVSVGGGALAGGEGGLMADGGLNLSTQLWRRPFCGVLMRR